MFRQLIQKNSLLQQMVAVPATNPAQSLKRSVRPKLGLRLVVPTIGLMSSYALTTPDGVAQIKKFTSVVSKPADTIPGHTGGGKG